MTKQEAFVVGLAALVLAGGAVCEFFFAPGSNAIARSGSLMVCIGILFAISDYSAVNMLKRDKELSALKANLQNLEVKEVENDIVFSDAELQSRIRGSTAYLKTRAIAIYNKKNTRAPKVDVMVGVLGTWVWGFGDLICKNLIGCG